MTIVRNISIADKPQSWRPVAPHTPLMRTAPETRGPLVLKLNGDFILRKDWPEFLDGDEVVEWYIDAPAGKEGIRTLLAVAAIAASFISAGSSEYAYLAYIAAAANVAYNLLVPPSVATNTDQAAAPVYNTSLSGNQAKLDDPIWRTFGADKITPPFAAQPYYEYRPGPNPSWDQYYFAIFAVGYGLHDLFAEFIGKTDINSFADVLVHAYLPPGTQPSTALANVVTSAEVSGLDLITAQFVGGFVATQPTRLAKSIGWDIVAPQGMGQPADTFDVSTITNSHQVFCQEIDDGGGAIGGWFLLASKSETGDTNTPQRWSYKQDLPRPMRVQVKIARSNVTNADSAARDSIQWQTLRAYLNDPAPLESHTAHYEIVMRASSQLSAQSQTNFSLLLAGMVRTWNPTDGWSAAQGDFANYTVSRNPAWALADLWSDPIYGEGLPDERIDLQSLYDLSLVWDQRQDHFDYTFIARQDAWSAGQLIASAGRARMFRRYGVRTLARDQLATVGEVAFSPRNCIGSMPINETLRRETDPDGIVVEYTSNVTWDTNQIDCPCPGVTEMLNPVFQTYDGIKGFTHAKREGLYHAADMLLRNRTVNFQAEMNAIPAVFLMPVRFMPLIRGYGQAGDVAFWDAGTLTMSLSEKPDFTAGALYLTLRRDDSTLTDPVPVTPGPDVWSIVLPMEPDFTLVLDDGTRERPQFLLGTLTQGDELVKISSITDGDQSPGGAQYYNIAGVIDDPAVHLVDVSLLPGPGDLQDPILLPGADDGGGTLVLVTLLDNTIEDGGALTDEVPGFGEVIFGNDGTLNVEVSNPSGPQAILNQWSLVPIETGQAAGFDIMATAAGFESLLHVSGSDVLGAWLNLGTTRSWRFDGLIANPFIPLIISIRTVSDDVIQATRTMRINIHNTFDGGGT